MESHNMSSLEMELLHNMTNSSAHHGNGSHKTLEGGFLSGRNPFEFNNAFPLPTFIIQLLVIMFMSRLVKLILSPIKQPSVIAEIISGILLGPTAMGHIPYYTETIFPKISLPFLNLMSNFGLVLFLFLVGLELDPRMLKKSVKKSLAISLAGMALPFGVGVGTSYALFTLVEPPEHKTSFTTYFLFLGVAMAITAFPVLARILTELNLLKTKVGSITVSAAAVDDATSWCLLALVISLINAGSGLVALYVFLIAVAYTVFLILGVRPIYVWLLRRSGAFDSEPSQLVMFLTLSLVFISAFITDAIGIHAIFGGFLAGIMMPHEGGFAYHITHKLEDIVSVIFLPLYFALSGLRTQIGSLSDGISWAMVLLVIFVACFGKICGCTLAARASQMTWRESLTVGMLMNCKGLVELIVLNLGYDAGVISDKTFAIMVIMALVTTFLTVPAVTFLYPPKYHAKPEDEIQMTTHSRVTGEPSLLVSVNKIEQVPTILGIIHLLESKYNNGEEHKRKTSKSSHKGSLPTLACVPIPRGDSDKHSRTKIVVNALRMIEITERDSSVMLQTSQDALRDDPVMKMFNVFGEITGLDIRGLIKVVTMENFASTMVKTAYDVNAGMVIVPWSGSGSLVEDTSTPLEQAFFNNRRRTSIHTPLQHSGFVQDLLATCTSTVLILVDRGLDLNSPKSRNSTVHRLVPSYQQIFLPFFGGRDDREALQLVIGISGMIGVRVNVVRYKYPHTNGNDNYPDSDLGSTISEDTLPPPEPVSSDTVDNDVLDHYFGPPGARNGGFLNLSFSEVESHNPVITALQYINAMNSKDLVLLGRDALDQSSRFFTSQNWRGMDMERKKVLGDFAESILLSQSASSILIVQARRFLQNGHKLV